MSRQSVTLTNVQPAANQLTFVQQPTDTPAGTAITPPATAQLLDSSSNPVRTANVPITLQVNLPAQRAHTSSGSGTQVTDTTGLATL